MPHSGSYYINTPDSFMTKVKIKLLNTTGLGISFLPMAKTEGYTSQGNIQVFMLIIYLLINWYNIL